MRRLLSASAATLALLSLPALAQDRPTLWNVLSLDRLVQGALHSGIGLIRTQMDLQYSDLSVDLRRSRMSMTDIKAWPLFLEWDETGGCEVSVDRIGLFATPIDKVDRITFKLRVSGLTMTRDCLPPDIHEGLDLAGLDGIKVPRLTLDIDYGMPKSDALIRFYAEVEDAATIDLSGDFAYFWFDGRKNLDEPEPVWFLRRATLAVENHGVWQAVEGILPPPMTGEGAGRQIDLMLTDGLVDLNREGNPDASSINDAQRAFVDSVAEAWPAFLATPETLVLETGFDGDTYLDFAAFGDDPAEIFTILQPVMRLTPARATEALEADLLRAAMGDGAGELTDEQRLEVGKALITGTGAPRNVGVGTAMLEPLAEAGDGAAALLLAEALAVRAPKDAYLWALRAGKAGEAGATAMLDRLERSMDFASVLKLQDDVSGTDSHPGSALRTISGIREQAAMRLSGKGLARNYGIASMWAILAKAAGDPEAADILEEIDELVRIEGTDAIAAWTETEASYAGLAMEVWIGQNLPARYAE